jgi:hypothetical protein
VTYWTALLGEARRTRSGIPDTEQFAIEHMIVWLTAVLSERGHTKHPMNEHLVLGRGGRVNAALDLSITQRDLSSALVRNKLDAVALSWRSSGA